MTGTRKPLASPVPVTDGQRFAGAVAYVLMAIPTLVSLAPYINVIGAILSARTANVASRVALFAILGLWLA